MPDAARLAEQLGFASAWAGDGPGAPVGLAAAAALTGTIGLGLGIGQLGTGAPAWTAKQLATIDRLAGPGRLRLAVGGRLGADGADTPDPGLDDALHVLPALLGGRSVDHDGRALSVHAPALAPPVASPPPVYVLGRSETALRRAARLGEVWLPMWLSPAQVAERATQLAEMAFEHERPAPRTALLVPIRIDEDRDRARTIAGDHLQMPPEQGVERAIVLDSIDGAVERLSEYRAVGVSEILLLTLGSDTLTQYERLAAVNDRLGAIAGFPTR